MPNCLFFLQSVSCDSSDSSLDLITVTYFISDTFVKVYLLQGGKKVSKKKTSTKRDERNAIFNEAMIFSVPANALKVS